VQRLVLDPELETDARPFGTLEALVDGGAEHGSSLGLAERDHFAPLFELAQEENVVDELGHLLDLGARVPEQRGDIGAGKLGGLQQRQQPSKRRA